MPFFIKKVRVELWDAYISEAGDADEVTTRKNDNSKEIFIGNNIGLADGDILVFGPFATLEEAQTDDCALVETQAKFLAVG